MLLLYLSFRHDYDNMLYNTLIYSERIRKPIGFNDKK